MEKTNEKKVLILSAIAVVTLIAVVVGATYAYFTAQGGGSANTNINVGTNTTDNLSFNAGSAINLNINQDNFGKDAGNQAGSTKASATLTANNATNNATANYYLYLNILSNNLAYTTEEETAELILTIKDPEGSPVTELSGYKYVTVGGVSGFDITTKEGLIELASNYEITSTGTETQEWEIIVTFVNLETDQNANTGKSFSASLIIQEDPLETSKNLASYITEELYTNDGENGLYYHDGTGSYTNADQEAGDNSYRYAGANPNNYVCFGSDEETCPNDNLYRIIGVFDDQVKLIKHDYAVSNLLGTNGTYNGTASPSSYSTYKGSQSTLYWYYWNNDTGTNTWSESVLNTVNLNTNYLNNIGSKWSNMIATYTWKVGGNTYPNIRDVVVKTAYTNEIVSPAESTTYNAKIGLMYASDYGYAASPDNWNTTLYNYDNSINTNNNWMYMGWYDWIISRYSDTMDYAFFVNNTGSVNNVYVVSNIGVRPCFYLEGAVEFSGGSGTQVDPFRIEA